MTYTVSLAWTKGAKLLYVVWLGQNIVYKSFFMDDVHDYIAQRVN